MFSFRQCLLLAVLLPGSTAFTALISRQTAITVPLLSRQQSLFTLNMALEDESTAAEDNEPPKPKPAVDPMPPPSMLRTPPSVPAKRLDPLLASLTRVDPKASNEFVPTTTIPFLGEVNMDKTLFIALPVVTFALLGFFSFFMVAYNSSDAVVGVINDWNNSVLNPTPTNIDPNECRGLCSSQEDDIEGLRNFMNMIGGGKK